jgi:hypothetical protein
MPRRWRFSHILVCLHPTDSPCEPVGLRTCRPEAGLVPSLIRRLPFIELNQLNFKRDAEIVVAKKIFKSICVRRHISCLDSRRNIRNFVGGFIFDYKLKLSTIGAECP